MHPAALTDEVLLAQCRQESLGRRGPGGQHVNKNKTGVQLTHLTSGIQAHADERRERQRNLAVALQRLRLKLALRIRGGTSLDDLSTVRQGNRLPVKSQARSYPLVVASLLDALVEQQWRVSDVAAAAQVTGTQIRKVLAADADVWQSVQQTLAQAGLPAWRRPGS